MALAKKDVETAIEMRRYEKIFQAEPGILRILNISNAEEIYIETAHLVEKKIKERKEYESDVIKCNNFLNFIEFNYFLLLINSFGIYSLLFL